MVQPIFHLVYRFRRPIIADLNRAIVCSRAAVALPKYLSITQSLEYCPPGFTDEEDQADNNSMDGLLRTDDNF